MNTVVHGPCASSLSITSASCKNWILGLASAVNKNDFVLYAVLTVVRTKSVVQALANKDFNCFANFGLDGFGVFSELKWQDYES